jgi:hypothetical protein
VVRSGTHLVNFYVPPHSLFCPFYRPIVYSSYFFRHSFVNVWGSTKVSHLWAYFWHIYSILLTRLANVSIALPQGFSSIKVDDSICFTGWKYSRSRVILMTVVPIVIVLWFEFLYWILLYVYYWCSIISIGSSSYSIAISSVLYCSCELLAIYKTNAIIFHTVAIYSHHSCNQLSI